MDEIRFFSIETVTEDILKQARDIANKDKCIVRLLWQPNRYNSEKNITIKADMTDEQIGHLLLWSRGPWGM